MITLTKGQSSSVVVTLTEATTIDEPYFTFEFTHKFTGEVKTCTAPDISTAIGRYNEFELTPDDGDELDGFVELKPGFHKYRCIQNTTLSTAIDPPLTILEEGIALVIDPNISQREKLDDYSGKTVKQWDGN